MSKWPMLPTIALFFIRSMWARVMIPLLPVVVTKMSPTAHSSSMVETANPSIRAWSAQIGSISVTNTRAPMLRRDWAHPLPTSP